MKARLVFIIAMALSGCGQPAADPPPSRPRATLAAARLGPGLAAIRTTGTLAVKDQIPLSFKVSGVIAGFNVDEGATVKAGQRLAELERTEVDSGLRQARELADKAQRDAARAEKLFSDQVITREQVEDARTAAAVAHAAFAAAQFNAGYAAIRAPGPGIVLRRLAEARQFVQAGSPVLILADESRGWIIKASVSDREVVNLHLGDQVSVKLDAFPGRTLQGRISQLTRFADARTGTFDLEVSADVHGLKPASGLLAKLEIQPTTSAGQLVHVPIESLIEGDRLRAWVFSYDARTHRVARKQVSIAFIDGDDVALESGVSAGERLVTAGLAYLRDGDQIDLAAS